MVSTMASGDVSGYVGASDICMMYSVTDVAGLNRISRTVLGNAAHQIAGAVRFAAQATVDSKPAVGLTMFGVTTPVFKPPRRRSKRAWIAWCFMPPAAAAERWKN